MCYCYAKSVCSVTYDILRGGCIFGMKLYVCGLMERVVSNTLYRTSSILTTCIVGEWMFWSDIIVFVDMLLCDIVFCLVDRCMTGFFPVSSLDEAYQGHYVSSCQTVNICSSKPSSVDTTTFAHHYRCVAQESSVRQGTSRYEETYVLYHVTSWSFSRFWHASIVCNISNYAKAC
jgi:hypothetical protein